MTSNERNRVYIIGAVTLIALIVLAPTFFKNQMPDWWPSRPLRLGLDLRGGSYLVLGVQTEEAVKSQLNQMGNALRSDLKKEKLGVIRAKARAAGVDNAGQAGTGKMQHLLDITMLLPEGEAGTANMNRLDAYIRDNFPELVKQEVQKAGSRATVTYRLGDQQIHEMKQNAVLQAIETIRNRVDQYGVTEPTIQRSGFDRVLVQLPDITNLDTVKETIGSVAKLEFRLVAPVEKPVDETIEMKSREGSRTRLEDEVLMTGDAVRTANVDVDPNTTGLEVVLHLNSVGKGTFDRITGDNVGRQLAIILDGVVQSAPVIKSHIPGGVAQISGNFTRDEAHRLAVVLRSGALPAPLTFEEERTVGATLGADAIRKGVIASAAGASLVVLFMFIYYRKSGILAVGCLTLGIGYLLALLALFGGTLTLPGIGGIALNIGMGVDASIVIFERIREELRNGATSRAAIDAGFLKAHWAIMDSNLTTLLSGLCLYGWGTGPIKGFAVTLCIGVLTTMFTALFVCRTGYAVLRISDSSGKLSI